MTDFYLYRQPSSVAWLHRRLILVERICVPPFLQKKTGVGMIGNLSIDIFLFRPSGAVLLLRDFYQYIVPNGHAAVVKFDLCSFPRIVLVDSHARWKSSSDRVFHLFL